MSITLSGKQGEDREIARLRELVGDLKRDNIDLRRLLAPTFTLPMSLGLTQSEYKLLCALIARKGQCVQQETLFEASRVEGGEAVDIQTVKVRICRIRAKLKPLKISIVTYWGIGYGIEIPQANALLLMGGVQ